MGSEKENEESLRKNQLCMARTARHRLDPILTSQQIYVAVYHNSHMASQENDVFIGEAEFELELDHKEHSVHKQMRLSLVENRAKSDRSVSGSIFVNYIWTPSSPPPDEEEETLIHGQLVLTVVRAVDLAPIDWTHPGLADPYVEVTVYPNSPGPDGALVPEVSYTSTICQNLLPSGTTR